MENAKNHQEFLGSEPIGRLLLKLSVPATVAMLVNALYNLVDTIFLGRGVGSNAIGGLSISLPAQMIIMAFGISIGTGSASIISRNLGAHNYDRANQAAGNAFAMAIVFGALTTLLGILFIKPLLLLMGASETLYHYAYDYLSIILLGAPFIAFAMVSNNILRAEGNARMAMSSMLLGTITNIILDPIFIFPLNMGIKGAALATIIGQFLSFIYVLHHFASGKSSIHFNIKFMKPDKSILKETFILGIPTFARQSGQSIVTILVNNLLNRYGGDIYISGMGIINRIVMFLFMPLFGMVQGFQPIAGYNYGAQNYKRVLQSLRLAIIIATIYTSIGFILIQLFPSFLTSIFTYDQELVEVSSHIIRLFTLVLPFLGFQIIGASYFQSAGKGGPSMILNLSRQFLFLIPLILILPLLFQLNGIILAFPIADALATIVTMFWLSWEVTHLKSTPEK
ncbi:MATE family efflux transporter [Spirochaeta cellobiosiphila]|uniref:MATE family efflux transporter n=1 Tax=Spirochaeta cellobiosiphila TaxID=504483 RepID=UPI0004215F8F|nr:MATE family efflux transporter [Spirochaeta cellobiosiphila]